MSLMGLINYILGLTAGTVIISLFLICVDDLYTSQRKSELVRWAQAFCISLGCVLVMIVFTSDWFNDFINILCNTEVF